MNLIDCKKSASVCNLLGLNVFLSTFAPDAVYTGFASAASLWEIITSNVETSPSSSKDSDII